MNLKEFFNDQRGDTNIVSIIIMLIVIIIAAVLFGPYLAQGFSWIGELF